MYLIFTMDEVQQEFVIPDGSFNIDIQPYMFEPSANNGERETGEKGYSSSDSDSSSDNAQSPSQCRTHNTDW